MAKKDPTDLTVEEKLKTLYQLQTTLSSIDEKRALRGELPLEVQDLEDEIAGLATRIENIDREIDQFDRALSQKHAEIMDAQASVERYQAQLETVSNNREYDTLSKEIEFQELEIQLCNKKIREGEQKIREKQADLDHALAQKQDRERGLVEKRAELDGIMEETREEEENLKEKLLNWRRKSSHVCLPASSVSARVPATVWVLYMYSAMPVAVASTRFHLSASWTSRCIRRLFLVSTAAVSSSTQNWLVLKSTIL